MDNVMIVEKVVLENIEFIQPITHKELFSHCTNSNVIIEEKKFFSETIKVLSAHNIEKLHVQSTAGITKLTEKYGL